MGNGFYIWENNYDRALQWAQDKRSQDRVTVPAVLGVVYQLDYCLDLTDAAFIDILADNYLTLKEELAFLGKPLPRNKNASNDQFRDLLIRELDCAVIENMHQKIEERIKVDIATRGYSNAQPFDTARGIFTEGGPAFEGAGIQSKNHIQVCIRNLNCIKGLFIPRTEIKFP